MLANPPLEGSFLFQKVTSLHPVHSIQPQITCTPNRHAVSATPGYLPRWRWLTLLCSPVGSRGPVGWCVLTIMLAPNFYETVIMVLIAEVLSRYQTTCCLSIAPMFTSPGPATSPHDGVASTPIAIDI